ncbi:MAG: hypothetical protein HY692_08915, partial [Cyanobacteria bacterium NC_groundwater_1444_Ag_S-0.65um_54_12]|nr:hypothetical protein [Cyanobacteria bacterium NC_groundwater_1444_Ag_S-0.65um_54_12]
LILYFCKKQQVQVTPPFKAYLEEKLLFSLFHHPALTDFWRRELSSATRQLLASLLPLTWILDPRPLPPYGVIPGLLVNDQQAVGWEDLARASKKGRQFVVKPSGFSALAWGSRGVSFGHDQSSEQWNATLQQAFASYQQGTPYVLQEFHKPARITARYYDLASDNIRSMEGRVRVCPYYFTYGGRAVLSGVLMTICPADKLALHGMLDAIIAPARVEGQA